MERNITKSITVHSTHPKSLMKTTTSLELYKRDPEISHCKLYVRKNPYRLYICVLMLQTIMKVKDVFGS